jgi:hypothetical protein
MGVVAVTLARRIGVRLAGRGRSAARLEVAITGASGKRTVRVDMLGRAPQLEAHSDEYVEALAEAIGDAIGADPGAVWCVAVTVVGESLAAVEPVAASAPEVHALALGSAPVAASAPEIRAFALGSAPVPARALDVRASAIASAVAPIAQVAHVPVRHADGAARSTHAQTRLRLQEPASPEVALRDALDVADRQLQRTGAPDVVVSHELRLPDAAHQEEIDALSVVLASTGTVDLAQVLQMSMAQGLERGAWREYRRTRRGKQRRRLERAAATVQPKLFKNLP